MTGINLQDEFAEVVTHRGSLRAAGLRHKR